MQSNYHCIIGLTVKDKRIKNFLLYSEKDQMLYFGSPIIRDFKRKLKIEDFIKKYPHHFTSDIKIKISQFQYNDFLNLDFYDLQQFSDLKDLFVFLKLEEYII
jgi:hypothetical protein